jgi:glycosyltransferase involved in cell wall biosynthesis
MRVMISFVMPVFNIGAGLLEEAVASVLALGDDVELIVVDDGSTAALTAAAVDALEVRDPRVKVIRQPNAGVATARNTGIQAASGEWISFIDPDDRCRPEMKDVLATLPDAGVDLVVTAGAGITMEGDQAELYGLGEIAGDRDAAELLPVMMSLYLFGRQSAAFVLGVPWAKFVRRSFLTESGLRFTDGMAKRSDAEWLIRLYGSVGRVLVIDVATVDYRLDVPGNISRRFRPEILDAFETLRKTAEAAPVSEDVRQLYFVELLKDAINSVFSSPAAPREVVTRKAFHEFRGRFTVSEPLLVSGVLRDASAPRKALYVVVKRGWFAPVRLLRGWKRAHA